MGYLLGTDEAGYGPNLGPLVISATLWHVPPAQSLRELAGIDLYERFREHVTADARPQPNGHVSETVWIADSKRLYKPGHGVGNLERGVLGSLQAIQAATSEESTRPLFVSTAGHHRASCWRELWHQLAPQSESTIERSPWYDHFDERLPIHAGDSDIQQAALALTAAFETARIRLVAIRSAVVFPQDFNAQLDVHDNKSEILSKTTLRLIRQLIEALPRREPVYVHCDKHGGRNRYSPLIQSEFPDALVEVHGESRPVSIYRLGQGKERVEMRFQAQGEGFLPAALASMTSKYLRELAMRAFNDFWCQRIDDLKPTAGYPVDARRFHQQIKPAQQRLRINDSILWRRK